MNKSLSNDAQNNFVPKIFSKITIILGLLLLALLALIIVLIIKLKLLKIICMDFSTIFLSFYDICWCGL